MEREYVATVDVPEAGDEPGDTLIKALSDGVPTADGTYAADVPSIHGRDVRVVVREGKNRMVRRYAEFSLGSVCAKLSMLSCDVARA